MVCFEGGSGSGHVGCGHAGRSHDEDGKGKALAGIQHEADPFKAVDVGDLVGIGYHGGGPTRYHGPSELRGGGQAGLNMDVSVNKPWEEEAAVQVHRLSPLVSWSHTHDDGS